MRPIPPPVPTPLAPADLPVHTPSELAGLRSALRRVYDLHAAAPVLLVAAACAESCGARWPCATRRAAAEALGLPEGAS